MSKRELYSPYKDFFNTHVQHDDEMDNFIKYVKRRDINHAEQKRQRDYIDFFSDFKPAGETSSAGASKHARATQRIARAILHAKITYISK